MKNLALILMVLLLLCQTEASSQPCLPNGITFTTQTQIDNFQINHPNCTEIEGHVKINGDDITNLNGLNVLTSIGGDLRINYNPVLTSLSGINNVISIEGRLMIWGNDALTSLTGLDNLTSIGGYLEIKNNDTLINLTGLDNVTSIGGSLELYYNDGLTSLTGLDNMTSIGGTLFIQYNHALTKLTGLDNVTSIGGSLEFHYNKGLTSLTGLDNMISIGGHLRIVDNDALTKLTGLDNVTSIGGSLEFRYNDGLTSLTGLDNVTSIGGDLWISHNHVLTSLTGLSNIDAFSISDLSIVDNITLTTCDVQSICDYLTAPGGTIEIYDNATGCNSQEEVEEACATCFPYGTTFTTQAQIDSFQICHSHCTEIEGGVIINGDDISNLNGLNNVTSIGETLTIWDNDVLTSLTGLNNLTSIGGKLEIIGNEILASLMGLDYIDAASINYVAIKDNIILTTCEVQSICDYLAAPGGTIEIHDNATGCNSQLEVEKACTPCFPYGITFTTQGQIDSFQINYPECTIIGGGVIIKESDITNLNGLNILTSIQGELMIIDNNVLSSLMGFENLQTLGGALSIVSNDALVDLSALSNLKSIGGILMVGWNYMLPSLSGLDSIDENTIQALYVYYNDSLTKCEVKSICNYLAIGPATFQNNNEGCNSEEEVEEACEGIGIPEIPLWGTLSIYPNPFSSSTTIEYELAKPSHVQLVIYNYLGEIIQVAVNADMPQGKYSFTWSPERLSEGMYYCVLRSREGVSLMKMIKQ
jgi:hypothetical protein